MPRITAIMAPIMITQMKNQDPTKPTDSSTFMSQTAQFTQVEKLEEIADSFKGVSKAFALQAGRDSAQARADYERGIVEPMRAFPPLRDLVTDVSVNFRMKKTIRRFQPRPPDAAPPPSICIAAQYNATDTASISVAPSA